MLKRILIAVGIFVLGFALVVGIVILQVTRVSETVKSMGEEAIPLVRAAMELSEQTRALEGLMADLNLRSSEKDRDAARDGAESLQDKLRESVTLMKSGRFGALQTELILVPPRVISSGTMSAGTMSAGASARTNSSTVRSMSLGAFLNQLSSDVDDLIEEFGKSAQGSQSRRQVSSTLARARRDLYRKYLECAEIDGLPRAIFVRVGSHLSALIVGWSKDEADRALAGLHEDLEALMQTELGERELGQLADLKKEIENAGVLMKKSAENSDHFEGFSKKVEEVRFEVNLLRRFADNRFNTAYAALGGNLTQTVEFAVLLSLLSAVFGMFVAVRIAQRISAPLSKAVEMVDRVSKHDLTVQIPVVSGDEAGRIGRALNVMVEDLRKDVRVLSGDSASLREASSGLDRISRGLTANANETCSQASVVSSSANSVSEDLESVAAAIEEMSTSMSEIARNAGEASQVANRASDAADQTNALVEKLGESSERISTVIQTITSIAAQTNLLALNASIEAARAGDAGKGFTVVANEVKQLAQETAKATEEIGESIAVIQSDAQTAVVAIREIGEVIRQIDTLQSSIAGAVEQQNSATCDISRSLSKATQASRDISDRMSEVVRVANETSQEAQQTANAAEQLVKISVGLRRVVEQFSLPRRADS
jgi:methyl-accepting chemotaxis protein